MTFRNKTIIVVLIAAILVFVFIVAVSGFFVWRIIQLSSSQHIPDTNGEDTAVETIDTSVLEKNYSIVRWRTNKSTHR